MNNVSFSIHEGEILTTNKEKFLYLLVIGIGGSALGPQFLSNALSSSGDKMDVFFFDNTDPDGMQKTIDNLYEYHFFSLCLSLSNFNKND